MAEDKNKGQAHGRSAPARGGAAVTPSDDTDLATISRGILVGAEGAVKITTPEGDELTIPLLIAGVVHPIAAVRIWATGTDAADIIALW